MTARRAVRAAVAAAAAATVVSACGLIATSVEVTGAEVSGDGTQLTLTVGSCDTGLSIRVKETAQSVTVYATVRGGAAEGCPDTATIGLEAPLGERRLIDGYDFTVLDVGL